MGCWVKKQQQQQKTHNLKVENYVLFVRLSEDFKKSSEGLFQRGKGGVRLYKSFYNKDQVVRTAKDYC